LHQLDGDGRVEARRNGHDGGVDLAGEPGELGGDLRLDTAGTCGVRGVAAVTVAQDGHLDPTVPGDDRQMRLARDRAASDDAQPYGLAGINARQGPSPCQHTSDT